MSKEKYEKAFALDMPFGEALERFAQTDPRELPEPKKEKKKRLVQSLIESSANPPALATTQQHPKGGKSIGD
jgi:hypothetical protein